MGLAEEEVLIRDDSGLLLDVGETRVPKSQEWTKKLTKTFCLSLGFLVLGLCVAIPGPTLLDLEDQVKATTFEMMIVFASRSMGYLLGALLGGFLFDCFDKQLLLFCTLLVSSVATVAIPWSLTLVVMATMFALQGITMGALDTGGNVFCIQLWGKKNPPFIQTLHFAFGIGAFVAPLLAKPFLSNGGVVPNTTSIVQGNIPVAPFLTDQLHSNLTRRSLEFSYSDFSRFNTDIFKPLNGKEEGIQRNKRSEINAVSNIIEGDHDLTMGKNMFKDIHERLKRQSGNDDNGYSDMWRWKKHKSKRDATTDDPNDLKSGTTKSDKLKTLESPVAPIADAAHTPGPDHDGAGTTDTGNTVDNADKNQVEAEDLVPENSQNKADLNTNTVTDKTVNVSDTSQAKGKNVSVGPNGTNSVKNTEKTTLITTQGTTTEVKFHKPNAATDTDREPDTADGKVIGKHIEDHKGEIPENTEEVNEPGSDSANEEKVGTSLPDISKDNAVNETASDLTVLYSGNATNSNHSKEVNITQFSSNINSSGVNDVNLPNILSTLKPKNVSEAASSKSTETVNAEVTDKPTTKLDTTTTTTTTTTKKPTTTTLPPTTTTTEKTTTTERTTTTTKKTTTTTTEKITTTTMKATTKEELTPAPTTHEKTESSTKKKTLPVKQPTQDKSKTDNPAAEVTLPPKVSSTNSSVPVVSSTNSTLSDDKLTTQVSKKPESTVDSFLNNAIHAVKNISKIQFAYLITGLALFLIAILFLVLYCKDKRRLTPGRDIDELERYRSSVTSAKAVLIVLLGVFFFCYMGLEVTFGALVTTFAVDFNKWPKEQGAMAAAIFWGSLATGRGLAIFLSRCCGPTVMLVIDLILMIIGGLVLSVGIHMYDKLLWLGTLILGLGMSSAFPAGISWAENYFHLTGKSTAVFVIGSALGQMIVPVITGYLYENIGAIVLMYTSLILSIIALVIFILMQCIAVKRGVNLKVPERNGFLPLEDDDDDRENLEMDDFVHFDKSQARSRHDKRGRGNAEYHTLISDLDDD